MKITYYGHSCFMMQAGGKKLLFDPFITPNELAAQINIKEVMPDYILVSHGHEDHTADLLTIAKQSHAKVIATWEIYSWLQRKGHNNAHPMNIGGKWNFDFGTVKMAYASHSSSFADGTYAGSPAGFIIKTENKTVYYSGDTALNSEMKMIGERHKPDVAFLPIGDNFTMDYEEAADASDFIQCNKIIAMHFDTFDFIKVDHQKAIKHFESKGKELNMLKIGSSIDI